ncbi:MAG: amino acid ABC transporter ATP-binding protein [Clostridia bacterium]|nr:amino acid ABC transporter ATP-binding protein [Clostridia bacterium]
MLKVENINKTFDDLHVLKGVSFCMNKGEVVAIIGSSGGGKTTLLRCLTFLEKADCGSITIDGDNIVADVEGKSVYPNDEELRKRALKVGLVFQDFNLFPHKSVLQNCTLAPTSVLKLDKAQAEENARRVLEQVGLSDKVDAYPYQLSGGQKQRVAIARALCMNPSLLCFDEPTSALDPELTAEVLKVIKDLKDHGVTMLIVTHEIDFAREVADTAIFLDNGVILEQGNAKELIDNPKNERTKEFLKKIAE